MQFVTVDFSKPQIAYIVSLEAMTRLQNYTPYCFFFGTFNPVHWGHLILAEAARCQLGLQRVLFIPAHEPPHRQNEEDMAPFAHRFRMVELACRGNPFFHASAAESEYLGPSYTIETLRRIIPDFDRLSEPLPLIIGADALRDLGSWHRPDLLAERVLFVQGARADLPPVERIWISGREVPLRTKGVDMPLIGISSTEIRERIRQGRSIRFLVPPKVADYISWNSLYR